VRDVDESKRLNNGVASKLAADLKTAEQTATQQLTALRAAAAAANPAVAANAFAAAAAAQAAAKAQAAALAGPPPVDATVVSEHFWPALQAADGGVTLHPRGAALLAAFNDAYVCLQPPASSLARAFFPPSARSHLCLRLLSSSVSSKLLFVAAASGHSDLFL
jgi:hypothetical protein